MKSFEDFNVGNLVKYSDQLRDINEISKITKIDEDKGIYELEILSTKEKMFYHKSDDHTTIESIYLNTDTLEKLGFQHNDNETIWYNGKIELISNSTLETETLNPILAVITNQVQLPKFTQRNNGYKVKNLVKNEFFLTPEKNELNINTLNELQNLYSEEIKISKLDLSKF